MMHCYLCGSKAKNKQIKSPASSFGGAKQGKRERARKNPSPLLYHKKGVFKMLCNAVIYGYLRRGLVAVSFDESENACLERRLLLDELRAVFIIPWQYVENRKRERDSKVKAAFMEAVRALYSMRANKARTIRAARRANES